LCCVVLRELRRGENKRGNKKDQKRAKNDFDDSRGIEAISLQMDMSMLGQKTLATFHEIW